MLIYDKLSPNQLRTKHVVSLPLQVRTLLSDQLCRNKVIQLEMLKKRSESIFVKWQFRDAEAFNPWTLKILMFRNWPGEKTVLILSYEHSYGYRVLQQIFFPTWFLHHVLALGHEQPRCQKLYLRRIGRYTHPSLCLASWQNTRHENCLKVLPKRCSTNIRTMRTYIESTESAYVFITVNTNQEGRSWRTR